MPDPTSFVRFDFVGNIVTWLGVFLERFIVFVNGVAAVSFFNLLWAFAAILSATIIYLAFLINRAVRRENALLKTFITGVSAQTLAKKRAHAWQDVAKLMASEQASDWKIAVLEADSILSQLLEDLGYRGENLGERLKSVPKGAIGALEAAWRAHKVRNAIAHDTATARLPRREAEETIANFERIFREFDYI